MSRTTVAEKHDYKLDVEVQPYADGKLISVAFYTLFPKAQRPHWVRNLQLNLTPEQLETLRNSL